MKELTEQELLLVAGGQSSNRDDDPNYNVNWEIKLETGSDGNTSVTVTGSGTF